MRPLSGLYQERLALEEDDDEGVQRERLDQDEAEDERATDGVGRAWVTGHRFGGTGDCTALREAAEAGRDGHTEAGGHEVGGRAVAVSSKDRAREGEECHHDEEKLEIHWDYAPSINCGSGG